MQSTRPRTAVREGGETISRAYSEFADGLRLDAVPEAIRTRACHLMLDAIGTGIAALGQDWADRAFSAAMDLGRGGSAALGHGRVLGPREAALINGMLMHGLDYDDTHSRSIIHATVTSLPATLAAADHVGASGADLLRGYILAMEVSTRLGSVAAGGFHRHGFHPTGLIGIFGATLGAGSLLGLNTIQLEMAQGISLSMASGSLEFLEDGAWTKRLHPGWAASSAFAAATIAKHGFVGPRAPYEGRFGLYALYLRDAAPPSLPDALHELGKTWEIGAVSVKPMPACLMIHAAADAAAALHAIHHLSGDEIAAVTVLVPEPVVPIVCEPKAAKIAPSSSYEAQFSVPYVVASALLKGRFTLDELDEASLADVEVRRLAGKVEYAIDPISDYPEHFTGEVIIETVDGHRYRKREAINRGSPDRPITNAEIVTKFFDNAAPKVGIDRATAVADAVLNVASRPAAALADALAAAVPTMSPKGASCEY